MPHYSQASLDKLHTCDERIQRLMREVIKHYDCTIVEGHRSHERQDELYRTGYSKVKAGQSKHNHAPSLTIDVVPYPIDWKDTDRFRYFGGLVKGIATQMGIDLRWGGDWDSDNDFKDQSFIDLPHFELRE